MKQSATSSFLPQSLARRAWQVLLLLGGASIASLILAGSVGSVSLSFLEILNAVGAWFAGDSSGLSVTLLELRLSRGLAAFVTGAALAIAGVLMQALLRNPLADPYVLGISGGAAVGALAAMLLGAAAWAIDISALSGAIAISLLLYFFVRRDLRSSAATDGNASMLLLTGVILASGCGALVTLMLSIAPDDKLRGMVFWLIGDLSVTPLRWLPWIALAAALLFTLKSARAINLLAQHAENAQTLGVKVGTLRQNMFICAAILTASAVTNAGSIGFVGLIVPHACRFAFGPDHRLLIPAAALAGGGFLVLADTLARTVIAPQQLPVGVITALIGVPVFLVQLHQIRKR